MSRLLFLTQRMRLGYGVDLVIDQAARSLVRWGHRVRVVCHEADATYRGDYEIERLDSWSVEAILALSEEYRPSVIIACTTPFFEMLPVLRHRYPCWAWEQGDPTPELFSHDAEEREVIKRRKLEFCYPVVDQVLVGSEFLRNDIGWPAATVLHNGCDHAPDLGSKGLGEIALQRDRPLRVGTLMRLGSAEAHYKGNSLFLQLAEALDSTGRGVEMSVMGRGTPADAKQFKDAGCRVHLDASDEEKWRYLRRLDVFVSCSLWEGFNLPLVEAQAVGTLAVAFDAGAHPEVCPFLFSSSTEMFRFILQVNADRQLLLRHSRAGYHFVRQRFQWETVAQRLHQLAVAAGFASSEPETSPAMTGRSRTGRLAGLVGNLAAMGRSLKYEGPRSTARKLLFWARGRRRAPGDRLT